MDSKKIGIIANTLNNKKTGSGQYLFNLLNCILNIDKKNEYFLINYEDNYCNLCARNLKMKKVKKNFGKDHAWSLTLPYKLRKNNFDLIFTPSQIPTFFNFSFPHIVSVLDIIPVLFPKLCWGKSNLLHRYLLPRTLKYASEIIAISQNTKNDLIKHFNIPEEKIRVIYLAANKNYRPLLKEEADKIKVKYELKRPFILSVGTLEPRKNIARLIEAFYRAKNNGGIKHKLALTGKKGWKYKNIFDKIEKLNLDKDIIFTGYIPDEDMPALYNAADLFVYPSLCEGFGLPPLEAMACGTPVITSNVSSLPEVVGDAGIMIDPYNIDEIAEKISWVIRNSKLKEELSEKGLQRAKMFSWEKCAEETLKIFRDVLQQ